MQPLVRPLVQCANGQPARLDSVLGPGFHLLGLDADPRRFLDRHGAEVADRLGVRTAAIGRTAAAPVHDLTGAWCDWMEEAGARLVLLRPDHYVFGSAAGPDAAAELLSELEDRLCLV
jgi:3-(3-hydroxy-phenyl)propionate hydroxylase